MSGDYPFRDPGIIESVTKQVSPIEGHTGQDIPRCAAKAAIAHIALISKPSGRIAIEGWRQPVGLRPDLSYMREIWI